MATAILPKELSEHELAELGYRQLWLFAWKHFPELSAMLPRRGHGQAKPQAKALNEQRWRELATIADSMGLQSDNITRLKDRNTDLEMARAFLHRARPQELFLLADENRRAAIEYFCELLAETVRPAGCDADDLQTSFKTEVTVSNRCGTPFEQSYKYTRSRFFLPDIYSHKER